MKRVCKYCGVTYEGDPGGSCCPECAAKQRETTLRPRSCRTCGKIFSGGPRALYCPVCRLERQREADRKRKKNGSQRHLGSTDFCASCGKPYVVKSGLQRFCPACGPEQWRIKDREASKAWNAAHTTPEQRRQERNAAAAEIPCVICGKLFRPRYTSITCSPECSAELDKRNAAKWEASNRKERNERMRRLNARHIGEVSVCEKCGASYTVTNSRQKYCDNCSRLGKNKSSKD